MIGIARFAPALLLSLLLLRWRWAVPWVQIQKSVQATWDDYERVQKAVGEDPPPGLIYHAAGEVDGGRWQSVSIWDSEDDFNRFRDERLLPAAREALPATLVEGGPPPSESFEAKHVFER
jgi:heme-degrading monooxygenase HmoA